MRMRKEKGSTEKERRNKKRKRTGETGLDG
jgi:hypothetical protein